MNFNLFYAINKAFEQGKEIHLIDGEDEYGYKVVATYDKDSSAIFKIAKDMKKYPNAELFTFDGDFHEELKY